MPGDTYPGLTPAEASRICMEQCGAMCCRGPLILELTKEEVPGFREEASRLGVTAHISTRSNGAGWVRFTEHDGEHCPMLDQATNGCRIYEQRPQRCHEFPERPTPGCAISKYLADG